MFFFSLAFPFWLVLNHFSLTIISTLMNNHICNHNKMIDSQQFALYHVSCSSLVSRHPPQHFKCTFHLFNRPFITHFHNRFFHFSQCSKFRLFPFLRCLFSPIKLGCEQNHTFFRTFFTSTVVIDLTSAPTFTSVLRVRKINWFICQQNPLSLQLQQLVWMLSYFRHFEAYHQCIGFSRRLCAHELPWPLRNISAELLTLIEGWSALKN